MPELFGHVAYNLRDAQKLTIRGAARKIGIPMAHLYEIEKLGIIPHEPVIRDMAKLYAADPDVLIKIAGRAVKPKQHPT